MCLDTRNAALNNLVSAKQQDLAALAGSQPGGLSHPGPGARPCGTRRTDDVSCGYLCQNPPIRHLLVAHYRPVRFHGRGQNTKTSDAGRSASMHPQPGYHACRRVRACKQLKNTVYSPNIVSSTVPCTVNPHLFRAAAHVSTIEPRHLVWVHSSRRFSD
jgi:hypothetical protein